MSSAPSLRELETVSMGGVRPGEFYSVKITNTYDGELVGVLYEEEEA